MAKAKLSTIIEVVNKQMLRAVFFEGVDAGQSKNPGSPYPLRSNFDKVWRKGFSAGERNLLAVVTNKKTMRRSEISILHIIHHRPAALQREI